MMAAVALTAMASCSDDLGISQSSINTKDADLVGTINISDEVQTRAGILETDDSRSFVWTEDDNVRVFTLEALTYHNYKLEEGANSGEGWFSSADEANLTGAKYAITEAANVYGVSADADGDAVLTMTLDKVCKVSSYEIDGNTAYKFPIPFWGECAETERADGKKRLDVGFNALTAYLRIDVATLPAGTKYIVLTTHGSAYQVQDEDNSTGDAIAIKDLEHGFQLAAPVASTGEAPQGFADTNAWWDAVDQTSGKYTNAPYITDGKSEPLTGTLRTKLIDETSALAVDERLVNYDYMIVPIEHLTTDDVEGQAFYIPVVARTYANLHVLAVTQLSRYSYRWIGTELKHYKNKTFTVGKRSSLTMNLQAFDDVDLNTLNKYIAENNTQAGRNTVINVAKLVNDDNIPSSGYNSDKLDLVGAGNLELNIAEIDEQFEYGAKDKPFFITDGATTGVTSTKTAVINLPEEWAAGQDGSFINVNLPTFKTVLGTYGGANSSNLKFNVLGSANQFVSGLELVLNNASKEIRNETGAAITVKNGISVLHVAEGTKGDVYVYSADEETEISDSLIIESTSAVDLRIDDALAAGIYIKKGARHMIYTTGKAATKEILDWDATTGEATTSLPYDTFTQSFYTGAGLSDYAWANGYDVKTIYTVAQLQSMGENRPNLTRSDDRVADYAIWDRVELMWLGADQYKWIGPSVDIQNFSFNGKNKRLMNMYLFTEGDETETVIYVDDPHFCCTSCGRPEVAGTTTDQLALNANLGLIRSIKEEGTAKVEKVNLNDVMLVTASAIDFIGSIVGQVDITGAFTFENNQVGEVKIDVNGDCVGGMIGAVKAESISATSNTLLSTKNDGGYVISDKAYVGGLIGKSETTGTTTLNKNSVTLQFDIEADGGYAGGLIGSMNSAKEASLLNSGVAVEDIISGASYAAGLVGYAKGGEDAKFGYLTVVANSITAVQEFAAGVVGQAEVADAKTTIVNFVNVDVDDQIKATEGFVGGLIGQSATGNVRIGQANPSKNNDNAVEVGKLAGSQSVGGVIGNNKAGSTVQILAPSKTANDETTTLSIDVNIADYENTYPGRDAAQHFTTTSDLIYYGTMQDLVGLMQDDVTIVDTNLTVSGALTDAKKKAVLYDLHSDFQHDTTTGELYWGDNNGYVGYSQNGNYTLNGTTFVGEQQGQYNYYKAY